MKIKIYLILLCLLSCLCASCATETIVIKTGYDFKRIKNIGILEFKDYPAYPNSGDMMSDMIAKYLLKEGYNVIERMDLEKLFAEQKLNLSGFIEENKISEIGKISGVDAIIVGSVPLYTPEIREVVIVTTREFTSRTTYDVKNVPKKVRSQKAGEAPSIVTETVETQKKVTNTVKEREIPVTHLIEAEVGITCKMISVETGEVIWIASRTYEGTNIQTASEYLVASMIKKLKKELTKLK